MVNQQRSGFSRSMGCRQFAVALLHSGHDINDDGVGGDKEAHKKGLNRGNEGEK